MNQPRSETILGRENLQELYNIVTGRDQNNSRNFVTSSASHSIIRQLINDLDRGIDETDAITRALKQFHFLTVSILDSSITMQNSRVYPIDTD